MYYHVKLHLCRVTDWSQPTTACVCIRFLFILCLCIEWIGFSFCFDTEPIPFAAMPVKRRSINSAEDWADSVIETALLQDWMTRHETLDLYMKSRSLKHLIPERLSPCQSKYGKLTGMKGSGVIALPEYCPAPFVQTPPLKQRKITDFFLENDQPK